MDRLKALIRSETRNWLGKGVIPPIAAENRRYLAKTFPDAAEIHLAFAAEWDRITAKWPERVRAACLKRVVHARQCASVQIPGSELHLYWLAEVGRWQAEADKYL